MSLQTRLSALITAVGTDIKSLSGRLDKLDQKNGFKVYRNAPFSVTDGTQLQYDTVEYDPDNLYKLAGPNMFQFVCPRAGLWEFTAQYLMQGSPGTLDTFYAVRFYKNGTGAGGTRYDGARTPNRGQALLPSGTVYINLAVGDTVEARCEINYNIGASPIEPGPGFTWFAGHQVGAT